MIRNFVCPKIKQAKLLPSLKKGPSQTALFILQDNHEVIPQRRIAP